MAPPPRAYRQIAIRSRDLLFRRVLMSIFRSTRRQTPIRRPSTPCLHCETLEGRELLTATARPKLRAATAQLGAPKPAQSSPFANLKAATGSPQVFQDAATARATQGLDGQGMTVAVIDTGVDYSLNALGNSFGTSSSKVIAGYDFGMNDGDPKPTWGHGTSVSSIIGSTDPKNPGIAPAADIVALRVFDDSGNSSFSKIGDALDWVLANHSKHKISVVNISISDSMNYTLNWFETDTSAGQRISESISKLKALNIPVVAASGNSFKGTQGMGFTAIVKDTISVTGVDPKTGQLASNAQRLGSAVGGEAATDIAAPSLGFNTVTGNGHYESVDGTSFAAPVVTGSIMLIQQKYQSQFGTLPTVDQVLSWLKQGGDSTTDPVTNLSIPQIDLAQSLALVPKKMTASPLPIAYVAPAAIAPTQTPVTLTNSSPTVKLNGTVVQVSSVQDGKLTLTSLQANGKWKTVDIWTGEAIARRNAASITPAPTGTLNKIAHRKQIAPKPHAIKVAKHVSSPPGTARRRFV